MHLVGLLDWLRRPARGFEIPPELWVLHHALEVLLGLPKVHDHHFVAAAGADMDHATRLIAGYGVLQLPVVGGQQGIGIAFPSEHGRHGHGSSVGRVGCLGYGPGGGPAPGPSRRQL
jgi:hypothetical protein